ncbi:LppA family lipoprotein [Mycobacteroides abscessus]|uniref:LppA family lipoprotein n=1 Tax=Mycobacteroides abscessus TaxID=36809 RepID=UPI002104B051|nr:LppA family lipoprotein [Mycobacteroides abscessus]
MNDPNARTLQTKATQALTELTGLPSLEDTRKQLEEAIAAIKSAVGSVVPAVTWQEFDKGAKANCSKPYDQSDGQSLYLPDAVAVRTGLSEENWSKIQEATREAASKLGATDLQTMQDKPGKHDIGFYGPAGIFIKLAYSGNLVISGYTGCRLPAAKK